MLFIAQENSRSEREERGRLSGECFPDGAERPASRRTGRKAQNSPGTAERKLGRTLTAGRRRKGFPDRIAESRAETALEERDGPGRQPSRIAVSFAGGAESGFFFCFIRCAASPNKCAGNAQKEPEFRLKHRTGGNTRMSAKRLRTARKRQ